VSGQLKCVYGLEEAPSRPSKRHKVHGSFWFTPLYLFGPLSPLLLHVEDGTHWRTVVVVQVTGCVSPSHWPVSKTDCSPPHFFPPHPTGLLWDFSHTTWLEDGPNQSSWSLFRFSFGPMLPTYLDQIGSYVSRVLHAHPTLPYPLTWLPFQLSRSLVHSPVTRSVCSPITSSSERDCCEGTTYVTNGPLCTSCK
jgi:hypothetical protein